MITPAKETVHLHVKDDIPYLVGDRNARSNRHRPVSEDIIELLKMLKEVIGADRNSDDGEIAEADEEVGEPQHALVGEDDGGEAVDFGPENLVKRLKDAGPSRVKTKLSVMVTMQILKQVLK